MSKTGIIYGVNGPVIYLKGDTGFKISEMVYVGPEKLVGEVIGLKKHMTTIQVFEETTGLKPGETVIGTGDAISVLLGPGIIHNIFDGIQRPLAEIAQASGKYISRGVSVDSLDTEKKWETHITVKEGDVIGAGTVIAETQETASILHKSMVPPTITHGTVIHAVLIPFWSPSLPSVLMTEPKKNWHLPRNGRSVFHVRPTSVSRPAFRSLPDSESWILFSLLPREALLQFQADSEQEKP